MRKSGILGKLMLGLLLCGTQGVFCADAKVENNTHEIKSHRELYDEEFSQAMDYMFRGDIENAKKLMVSAAERGVASALWYAYKLTGDEKYLIEAAECGDKSTYFAAAVALVNKNQPNTSVEDYKKAGKWYQAAADGECSADALDAVCNLAIMHRVGQGGFTPDYDKAMSLYQKAADFLHPRAVREIGIKYLLQSDKAEPSEKLRLFSLGYSHLAMAALKEDAKAAEMLKNRKVQHFDKANKAFIDAVERCIACRKYDDEVIRLLKISATENHLFANAVLGEYYFSRDKKEALKYFRAAAKQGNLAAKSMIASGSYYNIADVNEQMTYCKELADMGFKAWKYNYAQLLESCGDIQKAVQIFKDLAEAGDAHSQYRMYKMVFRKNQNVISLRQAHAYLLAAAAQHHGEAEISAGGWGTRDMLGIPPRTAMTLLIQGLFNGGFYNVSLREHAYDEITEGYAYGRGLKKDVEFAKQLCLMRVKDGTAHAHYILGNLYENGAFGEKDMVNAKKQYMDGAAKNDEACKTALKRLNSESAK